MNKFISATLALAMIFTFSCGHHDDNDYVSPPPCEQGSVKIGNQVWQKCNLDVVPTGENGAAKNSSCYDDDSNNCKIFGRRYDWATAMALPKDCNSAYSCAHLIDAQHRGLCPSGWHIPSKDEWDTLINFVGSDAAKLKATNGWVANGGNGTDKYGFSALPGGPGSYHDESCHLNGFFVWMCSGAGYTQLSGKWWTASENYYTLGITENVSYSGSRNDYSTVRCLKDYEGNSSSSSNSTLISPCEEGSVKIGDQVWQKCNLNVVPTDENGAATKSACVDNNNMNCVFFGRLYDWATAMALPDSCSNHSCSDQIKPQHRGICPSGWHIPSYADWVLLNKTVGGSTNEKLKATIGWYDNANGTDDYGFSALPGGSGNSSGSFYGVGNLAGLWSASEVNNTVYGREISNSLQHLGGAQNKEVLYSVRCLQDNDNPPSSSSSLVPCQDGSVLIGDQVWQKCNLNVVPTGENNAAENSACYDNKDSNCEIYGRLYDWATAMALPKNCNEANCFLQIQPKHRGICPSGWHIPSNDEWDKLMLSVDPYGNSTVGRYLKATSGWNYYYDGEDTYGFAALPGGYSISQGKYFYDIGNQGIWWSATIGNDIYNEKAYFWGLSNEYTVNYRIATRSNLYSVRCVQD